MLPPRRPDSLSSGAAGTANASSIDTCPGITAGNPDSRRAITAAADANTVCRTNVAGADPDIPAASSTTAHSSAVHLADFVTRSAMPATVTRNAQGRNTGI